MTLDLTQLTSQLEAQLADLSKQRMEIQKELDAILLVERASHRADSLPPEQEVFPSPVDPEPIPPVTVQPEERPVQEDEAPVEEPAAVEPVEAAPQEEAAAEPVEAPAEAIAAAPQEEVAAAEEPAPSEASPENTTEIKKRRNQLEETVMALELNDEVAVLELLKMVHQSLSPGKIAEELVAVNWNFQGQHPRAAVNAALQKMVNEGKVQQVNGGDYGVSI